MAQKEKSAITLQISSNKLEAVEQMAKEQNLSRDEFINQCIAQAFEQLPDFNPEN